MRKDTIFRRSFPLASGAPTPLHRINEVDVYKMTARAKDTIFRRSYLASGASTPLRRIMKSMFTKRPHEGNRIPWHRVPRDMGIQINLFSIIHVINNVFSNSMNDSSVHS